MILKKMIYAIISTFIITYPSFSQDLTIAYLSNVDGYLKACNCPGNLFGGLIYADDVIKNIKENNKNVIVIDGGDLFPAKNWRPKADYTIKLYNYIGLDILNIGDQEFTFGLDFLKNKKKLAKFEFITSNIYQNDVSLFNPFVIKKIDSTKVAFVGIVDPSCFSFAHAENVEVINPEKFLPKLIKSLKTKCDFIVLISHSGIEKDKEIAKLFPDIGLILGSHSEILSSEPEIVNGVPIVHAGSYAHYISKINIFDLKTKKPLIKLKQIMLKGVPVSHSVQEIYQDYLNHSDQVIAERSKALDNKVETYDAAPSAEDCGSCHFDEYSHWLTTPHAHAWETIKNDGRTSDLSCINCHTSLYNKNMGFVSIEKTPKLINVSCVSCHTDFQGHPEQNEEMKPVKQNTCKDCHDKANSPKFDFTIYRPAILHFKYYTVIKGDWLSKIALRYFNDKDMWTEIYHKNNHIINNPNLIYPGQKIIIPNLSVNNVH